MPVPTPRKGETQDKFMGRCMTFLHNENMEAKRPQKQMAAICLSQWREKSKAEEASSDEPAVEINTEFIKTFLEKHPEYTEFFQEKE